MTLHDRYTKHLVVSDSTTVNPSQMPENVILVNSSGQKISTKTDAELTSRYMAGSTFLPTGALAQTYPRNMPGSNIASLTSGVQFFVAIWLIEDTPVTDITFVSGSTAAVAPTNQWFALSSSARTRLAVTANDTTTAWAANTAKTLAVAGGPYSVPSTGLYYLSAMVSAGTTPSLIALNGSNSSTVWGLAPALSGTDNTNTGLTTTASAPATAAVISINDRIPYAYVR